MLSGLIAAVHTPFDARGNLNLDVVPAQAFGLKANGIETAFIGGSTGESASLSLEERLALTEAWVKASEQAELKVVVHVGSNCLRDSQRLARQAEEKGALAVAAFAPSYFKPANLDLLVDWCDEIAASAPGLPFYFYDIPALTGVRFPMVSFLRRVADRTPNFKGIKYTNHDLMAYQQCLHYENGRFDIPWGVDESLLGALAVGAKGAVGSSYNFAAPVYQKLMAAFAAGDIETARECQMRSVRLIELLASYGYMAAAKATMKFLGIDVGQPRLPNASLGDSQVASLEIELRNLGFFEWVGR